MPNVFGSEERSSTKVVQYAGGAMLNAITGERLQDLFVSEPWQDLFTMLSDSFGFSLSVYAQTGKPLFASMADHSPCSNVHATAPGLESPCKAYCHSRIMNALATGKPEIYKCLAKIMCFALPVEYLGDKAVILGRGSFSSYEDFRECMNLATAGGTTAIAITAPLTFTTYEQAWKACRFVSDTMNLSLQNMQETAALRKKLDSLMSVFSLWGSATVEQPEMRYQGMLYNLSTLLDIDHITILSLDQQAGKYTGLYGLSKSGAPAEEISIDARDPIVTALLSGKPLVRTMTQAAGPASKAPAGRVSRYFFPILVNNTLGGILCITNKFLLDRDRQIIAGFCKQTALFIENYQLHQDLYKKFNRFASMSELNRAITPIQNYDALLQMILDKSAELLKAEQGSLMMLDRTTDALLLEARKGVIHGVSGKICIQRGEGIAGKVAERGEPLLVKNLEDDPRVRQKNRHHYRTRSFVSVPLMIADRVIGVLNLSDKTTGEVFDEEDLKLIQSIASHAAVVVERNEFYAKSEALKKLTITDALTGILNRRYLQERLLEELARSERHMHPMSLLMLDLDGFKICNDSEGHLVGDRILQNVADTLSKAVRSMDILARYGGDEFMVILPETSEQGAIEIAERLRDSVSKGKARTPEAAGAGPDHCLLTASIGIVCYPEHGETVELLLENVDKALYRAKNKGKNRIEVFS